MQLLEAITPDNRDLWLSERSRGIGGSEMAAILGFNPYSDAAEVYMGKLGMMQPDDLSLNEAVEWGTRLESAVAQKFADGHPEFELLPGGFWRRDDVPIIQSSPDRLIVENGIITGILEIKTTGWKQAARWGEEGTDDVPRNYHIQCDHYMAGVRGASLSGHDVDIRRAYLCPLIGGQSYREYIIPRDLDLEDGLIQQAVAFWTNHVLAQEPPELTWMASSKALVGRMFPASGDDVRECTAQNEYTVLSDYRRCCEALTLADQDHALAENRIKAIIGDSAGIQHAGIGRVTWKNTKGTTKIDYEQVVAELLGLLPGEVEVINALVAKHTQERPGYRRINKRWEEQ